MEIEVSQGDLPVVVSPHGSTMMFPGWFGELDYSRYLTPENGEGL